MGYGSRAIQQLVDYCGALISLEMGEEDGEMGEEKEGGASLYTNGPVV